MITDYVRKVRAELDSEIERETGSTGRGSAKNFDDYRYRVGIYTGLKRARDLVDSIFKQYLNDDEGE